MAITYTENIGLPLIDLNHDGAESASAMKAGMAVLDAFPSLVLIMDGEVLAYESDLLYYI